jgi:hypothetical protein
MTIQNYINHVVLVLDGSSSMQPHKQSLIAVADGQVKYLARRSQELDQETRVSVYMFANTVECLIYDKDVLRLPSIAEFYKPHGMTALLDATARSLTDLDKTATLYGDHAFLVWILTDGQENASKYTPATQLSTKLRNLPENWTVGVLVPDQRGVFEAKGFGFPADNIAVWDATSAAGIVEAGETIRTATDNFMVARSQGIRGTRSIFSTGLDAVNSSTVHSTLTSLPKSAYQILPVTQEAQIRDYVNRNASVRYVVGKGYYQLTKTETIQPTKHIAVLEKSTGKVYTGPEARQLIGLPDREVRVKPQDNPQYDVFVQSTSVNRKVLPNTKVLVLN